MTAQIYFLSLAFKLEYIDIESNAGGELFVCGEILRSLGINADFCLDVFSQLRVREYVLLELSQSAECRCVFTRKGDM